MSTGFLERNTENAFECLTELLATPNFNEPQNISDLLKQSAIGLANNLGNRGLQYARSYSASALKPHARAFESLENDIFLCQFVKKDEGEMMKEAIEKMGEIASYVLREENMEIAVHGSTNQFADIQSHLESLLKSMD
jgi:Zn-dependent M16 (insulinase) family peptidase